jgi:hypothetical protein
MILWFASPVKLFIVCRAFSFWFCISFFSVVVTVFMYYSFKYTSKIWCVWNSMTFFRQSLTDMIFFCCLLCESEIEKKYIKFDNLPLTLLLKLLSSDTQNKKDIEIEDVWYFVCLCLHKRVHIRMWAFSFSFLFVFFTSLPFSSFILLYIRKLLPFLYSWNWLRVSLPILPY